MKKTLDDWFEFALDYVALIPIAIFDYKESVVRYQGKFYRSVEDFENYWNEQRVEPHVKVILESYGFSTGINGYKTVDIKHLKKLFKTFVEKARIKTVGKPPKEWLPSYWVIPVTNFRKDLEITYPRNKPIIVENQDVDVEKFQKKMRGLVEYAKK